MLSFPTTSQLTASRSSVRASFAGLLIECFLFGTLIVVYGGGTWMLLARQKVHIHGRESARDTVFHVARALMFILSAVHVGTDIHIAVASGLGEGADVQTIASQSAALNAPHSFGALKLVLYVAQTLIADGFMIYRAFIVCNSSWRIIAIPVALLVCEAVFGFALAGVGRGSVDPITFHYCNRAYFLLTLMTNLVTLGLIMKPVILGRAGLGEYRPEGSRVRTVRWRMIESILQSAAIFTISSLTFTVTLFVSPIGLGISHYIFPSIVSLVFSIAVTRISLNAGATEQPRRSMLEVNLHGPGIYSCPSLPTTVRDVEEQSCCSMRPIAIHVSVSTMQTTDLENLASLDESSVSTVEGRCE